MLQQINFGAVNLISLWSELPVPGPIRECNILKLDEYNFINI